MSVDKLVDSAQLNSDLTSVANAIRTKGGTSSQLAFPSGFVSAVNAIPTGITPTGTKSISITANGTTTEDVTNYASAEITTNVSPTLKLGVIRPDAELVQTWSYDKLIHEDEGITIPAYTTTDTTLKAWGNLTSVSIDRDNYDHFVVARTLTVPIYSNNTAGAGRQEYSISAYSDDIKIIPANTAIAISDGTTKNSAWNVVNYALGTRGLSLYWSSATALTLDDALNAGAYQDFIAQPSLASINLTPRSPALKIKGDTTRLNSTYWGYLTDIRYQYVIELYRAKRGNLNYDGWTYRQLQMQAIDCANSSTHKLT